MRHGPVPGKRPSADVYAAPQAVSSRAPSAREPMSARIPDPTSWAYRERMYLIRPTRQSGEILPMAPFKAVFEPFGRRSDNAIIHTSPNSGRRLWEIPTRPTIYR